MTTNKNNTTTLNVKSSKKWNLRTSRGIKTNHLAKEFNLAPIIIKILHDRGFDKSEKIWSFLNPCLNNLTKPFNMADINIACELVEQAIINKDKIAIYGDYDVDGVTGTVLITDFLRSLGADCTYYLPHRQKEGYGLNKDAILTLRQQGVSLLITVDCGISDHDEVQTARDSGMKIIITDHHTTPDTLPNAHAILNPKRVDCGFTFKHLAGVGVVFYFIIALRARLKEQGFFNDSQIPNLKDYLDLVALGTISDIVPLCGDNRILVSIGLEVIMNTKRPGLKALILVADLLEKPQISSGDVGYRLGPRINAAGRMEHASIAARLLLSRDAYEGRDLAQRLDKLNQIRQTEEEKTLEQALIMIENNGFSHNLRTIVLNSSNWDKGIIGIVASRMVERFYRPAIIISNYNGISHGSGRSIHGLDIYKALSECDEYLIRFGGHKAAAGITLKTSDIDSFSKHFDKTVSSILSKDDFIPNIMIDAKISLKDINKKFLSQVGKLAPFGMGNPEPIFISQNITFSNAKLIKNKHLKFWAEQDGIKIEGIGFNMAHIKLNEPSKLNIAFTPRMEFYRGFRLLKLRLKDVGIESL